MLRARRYRFLLSFLFFFAVCEILVSVDERGPGIWGTGALQAGAACSVPGLALVFFFTLQNSSRIDSSSLVDLCGSAGVQPCSLAAKARNNL